MRWTPRLAIGPRARALFAAACLPLSLACVRNEQSSPQSSSSKSPPAAAPSPAPAPLAERAQEAKPSPDLASATQAFTPPVELRFPAKLSPGERVPFVLVLHGYGVSSALLLMKSNLEQFAEEKHFAYAVPDGNRDKDGRPFWNAGPSCCDTDKTGIDDTKRLLALLDAARARADVDPARVFVIGYSNGGFMAHRLACEGGGRIAAMISVSGAAPATPCVSDPGLSIVEIHGDADPFVRYEGGTVLGRRDFSSHPAALETVRSWAQRLGCAGEPRAAGSRDLEPHVAGAETTIQRFEDCRGAAELWTVRGGGHYVALARPAFEAMWDFLQQHPRK